MKTDIEIAQSIELKPIVDVVEKLGISYDDLGCMESTRLSSALIKFVQLRAIQLGN